jgi:hypothetical protein
MHNKQVVSTNEIDILPLNLRISEKQYKFASSKHLIRIKK